MVVYTLVTVKFSLKIVNVFKPIFKPTTNTKRSNTCHMTSLFLSWILTVCCLALTPAPATDLALPDWTVAPLALFLCSSISSSLFLWAYQLTTTWPVCQLSLSQAFSKTTHPSLSWSKEKKME